MAVPKKIIRQCKKNDRKAQEYIFNKYSGELLSICYRYIKNKTKAEDVLHDAFITIFSKINQYKGTGSFEGWIKRITLNTALIQLRKDKKEIFAENFDNYEIENQKKEQKRDLNPKDVQSVIEHAKFDRQEIIDAMNELPEGFKTVFNLYVVEGYKHKDIATELGISEGTSKSQLSRARIKLKEILYKKAIKKIKGTETD